MIKNLLITSAGAFVISVACLAGAAALVRHDLNGNGWDLSFTKVGDHVHMVKGEAAKPEQAGSATLAWPGGNRLAIDLPGHIVYSQGKDASVSVSGPQSLVNRVRIDGGRLYLATGPEPSESIHLSIHHNHVDATGPDSLLRVTIVAPAVTSFAVSGSSDLSVHDYDQPALDMALNGSGAVDVDGRTPSLRLEQAGSGAVDLTSLKAQDADVSLSGSGNAIIHASGKAQVGISGSGTVALTTKPVALTTSISGSGTVNQDY